VGKGVAPTLVRVIGLGLLPTTMDQTLSLFKAKIIHIFHVE